ncbi:site-specific integrase, partial [Candidatus Bathyarchaeota archaeon]|nr:site-specific integrase [Candidatus Bathyarchaeota archaeon]
MKKNGLAETTIVSRIRTLKQLARMTDLQDTEATKATIISQQQWNKLTQRKHAEMYEAFLRFTGKTWKRPHIKPETRLPFIPTETEIDQLIASCAKHTATLLQTLKETGIRISEAAKLHWIDLSTEQKTLNITPTKGSNPRILPISTKLIDMINQMPQNRETIFGTHTDQLRTNFSAQRQTTAKKLQNQRILRITFHTFRHWKATMEYHKTRDILHVQQVLGHRDLRNTLIYINLEKALFQNADDEFHVKVAQNLDE